MEKQLILLVEDNPDEVKLAEIALKKIDIPYDLVVAKDGVEALNYFTVPDGMMTMIQALNPT
jgi:two-component system response regulator